jgi:hypothetical protein
VAGLGLGRLRKRFLPGLADACIALFAAAAGARVWTPEHLVQLRAQDTPGLVRFDPAAP